MVIYHIADQVELQHARKTGFYRHPSLKQEGFIHFSFEEQVIATANRFFHGQKNLILLKVDSDLLEADLKIEKASHGGEFPHLYGELNLSAVVGMGNLVHDGEFRLPGDWGKI